MDYLHSNKSNDYEYRRKKAFQSISNGTLTNLMLLLDGLDNDVRRKLLVSRSDQAITLRRPSTARNFQILDPTLLASACAEWYMEIVEFLAGEEHGTSETVSVKDESNDVVQYDGVTPLCIATITGKFKMVQILLEHGAAINHENSIGNTALFEACFEGHISIVNYLIQRGANIEQANHRRVTCLMIASYNNNLDIVKVLTNLGANVNKKDTNGRSALFYCIASGSLPIFKLLQKSGAVLTTDQQGTTVLMEAAYYGQYEMVKWMMKNRDNLKLESNAFDKKGRNALCYCAEAGNMEIFQLLLNHGLAIHPALDGSTVLMMATLRGRHKIIEYFQENLAQLGLNLNSRDKRGRNCLFYCVSGGDIPLFDKLVKFGAAVECAGNGVNLLQQAAVKGDQNFCQYLLDHADELGLDIQGRDQDGWSALFFAIASGNLALFRLLYERGVNTDPASDGRTLLMQASIRGNLEMIRHILGNQSAYQSEINEQDNFGRSALYMSVQSDAFHDAFKILLDRGAIVNKTNHDSNIFMETVKVTKSTDVLKMLIKMEDKLDFSIHDLDSDGKNVLFYAAENGNTMVMDYLLSLGTPFVTDNLGRTVLMTAAEKGHLQLVEILLGRHRELFLDLEFTDSLGRNVLFYTLELGSLECFRALVEAGVPCVKDDSGVTVLMLLAESCHKDFVDFVVTARNSLGVDIQAKDLSGDAAIHYAVRTKQYDNLLLLIQNGGDLVVNGNGESVVSQCVDEGDFWVVEALATSGVDLSEDLNRRDQNGIPYFHHLLNSGIDDALMIALIEMYYDEKKDADSNGVTMAMKLVDKESLVLRHLVEGVVVDLNRTDGRGRNILQHCAFANNLDNVKYFLAYGATFMVDGKGGTALMESARGCHDKTDCLRHLLKYIFKTEESRKALDTKGRSALHHGVQSGRRDCVEVLLDNGLDIDLRDHDGMTPFLLSAKTTHPEVLHLLAKRGADVNAKNNQSQNALHIVFENEGASAVTQALISRGCDVNARDQSERTPLMLAARKDNLRPIKFLLENGADASLVDAEGHDALFHCPGDHHIIRVLITKHRDGRPPPRRSSIIDVFDAKLLTQHLLREIRPESRDNTEESVTDVSHREDSTMARGLERVVSGVVRRQPQAFDSLCNALKNAPNGNPETREWREFYV